MTDHPDHLAEAAKEARFNARSDQEWALIERRQALLYLPSKEKRMNGLVLSDLTWVLPKVLQKVPWQVRAVFLAIITLYGTYAIGAQIFDWPLSKEALEILGILAVPAGLPALSNVTVHKGTSIASQPVENTLDDLMKQLRAEFTELHARMDHESQASVVEVPVALKQPVKKAVAKRPAKKSAAKKAVKK